MLIPSGFQIFDETRRPPPFFGTCRLIGSLGFCNFSLSPSLWEPTKEIHHRDLKFYPSRNYCKKKNIGSEKRTESQNSGVPEADQKLMERDR